MPETSNEKHTPPSEKSSKSIYRRLTPEEKKKVANEINILHEVGAIHPKADALVEEEDEEPHQQPPEITGLRGRFSPLGNPEYVVPPSLSKKYLERPDSAAETHDDSTTYYSQKYDDPETRTHERIHVAQYRLPNQPTVDQLAAAFRPLGISKDQLLSEYGKGDPASAVYEAPAYIFQDPPAGTNSKQQRQAYNNYLDLIRKLNPDSAESIEATMPTAYELNYLRTSPPPVAPPSVEMSKVGLLTGQQE